MTNCLPIQPPLYKELIAEIEFLQKKIFFLKRDDLSSVKAHSILDLEFQLQHLKESVIDIFPYAFSLRKRVIDSPETLRDARVDHYQRSLNKTLQQVSSNSWNTFQDLRTLSPGEELRLREEESRLLRENESVIASGV